MRTDAFILKLVKAEVPKKYQERFNSKFAVVTHLRDYGIDIDEAYYWMAWEAQQPDANGGIIERLHQRYSSLRTKQVRDAITEVFGG